MLDDRLEEDPVSFRDLVLYLQVFRHSLVPPVELPEIIWGLPIDTEWPCASFQTITTQKARASWLELSLDRRVSTAQKALDAGLSASSLSRFLGNADATLIHGLSAQGVRRGRPVQGRQLFRSLGATAHANAFIDAFRLQLYQQSITSPDVIEAYATAFAAYRSVVDVEHGRLDAEQAFAVVVSAVSGELTTGPCFQSLCWHYFHREFPRSCPPWLSYAAKSVTMADRVRYYLLYYVPEDERPSFSQSEILAARSAMREGTARWRPCGRLSGNSTPS
jgi:hypothetical protein